ncbi:MAG: BON domain-containing protein, partial [Acidobacteriota bacterium]
MSTHSILRRFTHLAGASVALASCLWILGASPALAQSGDTKLQAAVSDAVTHDAMLKNQPITASVSHGIVTLTGTVETEQQRQQAETDAANVPGVSGIANDITVTGSADQQQAPPPPPDDNQQPQATPEQPQAPPPPPDTQQPSAPQ